MTESFSPSGTDDAASADERRKKVLAGGLLGAIVVGAGAYFFVLSGGEEEDFSVATPRRVVSTTAGGTAASTPAKKAAPVAVLPAKNAVNPGRNPYKALIVAPETGGATGGTGAAVGGGTVTGGTPAPPAPPVAPAVPTAPGVVVVPTTPVTPPTAPPAKPTTPIGDGTVYIQMNYGSVLDNRAGFDVGTKAGAKDVVTFKSVRPGDTFGKYFRLMSITYDAGKGGRACARLAFGDSALNICSNDSRVLVF